MIGVGNLMTFLRQLMPLRLRRRKRPYSSSITVLLDSLLSGLDADTTLAQDHTVNLLSELRYTSQVQALKELVESKYNGLVKLIDSNVNGNLVLFAVEADEVEDYRQYAFPNPVDGSEPDGQLLVYSDEMTDVGYGFIVLVKGDADDGVPYVELGEIGRFLRRYVFLGVNFKFEVKQNI